MALSNLVRQRMQQNFGIQTDEYDAAQEICDAVDVAILTGRVMTLDSAASVGGSASEALTVTGLLTTDVILAVSQKTAGGNGTALTAFGSPASNSLTVTWTANPGAGAVVRVLIKR